MRLINVKTLRMEEFLEDVIPPYAILSHTWGPDSEELTLRDIEEGNINKHGVGSIKLRGCCGLAQKDGLGYAWVDTCCIDKTNLVELSEAINSMFRWYMSASLCYVYMSDVPSNDDPRKDNSKFQSSRWFQRGWTLQELLAPKNLRFYSSDWRRLGTKGGMCTIIERITRVPRQFLLGIADLRSASVAQRMSWAARRETKRKEDLAYCLLGIFGVTMPMIYGEGSEQAFLRLQEQIMKTTRDDSILAWGIGAKESLTDDPVEVTPGRILAASPSDFANSHQIVSRDHSAASLRSLELSGGSLRVSLSLTTTSAGRTVGLLRCGMECDEEQQVGIPLAKSPSEGLDEYIRPRGFAAVLQQGPVPNTSPRLVLIRNDSHNMKTTTDAGQQYLLYDSFSEMDLELLEVAPEACWDKERALIILPIESDTPSPSQVLIRFRHNEAQVASQQTGLDPRDFLIVFKLEHQGSGVEAQCCVMICDRNTLLGDLVRKLMYITHKANGTRSASNGVVHMHIVLEPVARQPVFVIRPEALPGPPDTTPDATTELRKLNLALDLADQLKHESIYLAECKDIKKALAEEDTRRDQTKREQLMVEEELAKLERRRKELLEEDRMRVAKVRRLGEEYDILMGEIEFASMGRDHSRRLLQNLDGGPQSDWGNRPDYDALLRWASKNHTDMVQMLLETHFSTWIHDHSRDTPISQQERDILMRLLSNKKFDTELKDSAGLTPLLAAAKDGHEILCQLLLARGADIGAKDARYGRTALFWAVQTQPGASTEATEDEGIRITVPLLPIREGGCLGIMRLLLEKGADIEATDIVGNTTLLLATASGCEGVVRLLLEKGADVEARIKWLAGTALWHAANHRFREIVQLLLEKGADTEARDRRNDKTALLCAAKVGQEDIVRLLLDKGADMEAKDDFGRTALLWAVETGQEDIVRLLLDKGANMEARDNIGRTALLRAAEIGLEDMMLLLLGKGADIEVRDERHHKTALFWARTHRHEGVVRMLTRNDAKTA